MSAAHECVADLTARNAITASGQLLLERLDAFRNLGPVGANRPGDYAISTSPVWCLGS